MRIEPWWIGFSAYVTETPRELSPFPPFEDTVRRRPSMNQGICPHQKLPVPGSGTSQAPELRELNVCCVSHPGSGILLEHPEMTKTMLPHLFLKVALQDKIPCNIWEIPGMEKFRSLLISHSHLMSATQQGVGQGDILYYKHHKGNCPQVKMSLMGILLTFTSFCYFD